MFKNHLQKAAQHLEGTRGIILLGFDGIPIATHHPQPGGRDETLLETVAIELANMLRKLTQMSREHEIPPVGEFTMSVGEQMILTQLVLDEYLLVMAVDQNTDLDKGMRMLRLLTPGLEQELK